MGKTAHDGPVYGAKGLLCTFGPLTNSTGASTGLAWTNAIRVVPAYEDWFVTEAHLTASTNSSVAAAHAVYLKTEGGSTTVPRTNGQVGTNTQTIVSMVNAAGSTTWSTNATATPAAGEYEGAFVPAGSTLRLVSSGASAMTQLFVQVMGYIRWIPSTRAV